MSRFIEAGKVLAAGLTGLALTGCDGKPVNVDFSGNVGGTPIAGRLELTGATPTPGTGAPRPTDTPLPAIATATPEALAKTKTLPKPAAWDHEPIINLIRAASRPAFPRSAAEAATTFGVDGSTRNSRRWERTAEGDGWHLSEAQITDDTKDALNVNARGYLLEFFYDTEPGRNPYCAAVEGIDQNIPAQGGTFWNETGRARAEKLQREMAVPRWRVGGRVEPRPCEVISP